MGVRGQHTERLFFVPVNTLFIFVQQLTFFDRETACKCVQLPCNFRATKGWKNGFFLWKCGFYPTTPKASKNRVTKPFLA